MRTLLLLCLAGCGSTRDCAEGTVFLGLRYDASAAPADAVDVSVTVGGQSQSQRWTRRSGSLRDTLEITFAKGYPSGQNITVGAVAWLGDLFVGEGVVEGRLGGSCAALTLEVTNAASTPDDLAGADLAGLDFALSPTADLAVAPGSDLAAPPGSDLAAPIVTGPETLEPGVEVSGIAVDDSYVYWTSYSAGTVSRRPLAGGAIEPIAMAQDSPSGIATDGTYVYWANRGFGTPPGSLQRAPVSGGGGQPLVPSLEHPDQLLLDGSYIYLAVDGKILRAPKTGAPSASDVVGDGNQAIVYGMVMVGTDLYYSGKIGSFGYLMRVPATGGSPTMLSSQAQQAGGIAYDGVSVFWVNGGTGTNGTINQYPVPNGQLTPLISNRGRPKSVATDGTSIYWVEGLSSGSVVKGDVASGLNVSNIATGQAYPNYLVLKGDYIYWATTTSNRNLMRAHK